MKPDRLPPSLAAVVDTALSRLFGRLPDALTGRVWDEIRILTLSRGEQLYAQGEKGASMHVVLTGKLDVSIAAADGSRRTIASAQAGESVGEMALLTQSPRAATLTAARDSILAEVPGTVFDDVLRVHPQALADISRMIIRRLTQADARAGDQVSARSIAVVPGTRLPVVHAFVCRLARELLRFGSVLHVIAEDLPHRVRSEDPLARNEFLEHASHTYDFLLLECHPENEDWSRTAIGFADRVFLIAAAGDEPDPAAAEIRFLGTHGGGTLAPTELILLHDKGDSPGGTRSWLEGRTLLRHFHVPLAGEQGVRRMARDIARASVGVVFAGGGARGFAHLGVIRALYESGVAIDHIGGTSFGAIAATGPARGFDIESMIDELRHVFTQERPLDDYTLPMVSLVHGERLDELLRKYLDFAIEDLWLPYFCVSSNLTRNRVEIHDRGSLWRAVRASISLPAILPPVIDGGNLLIDGGVLNNLPVDVMAERLRGHIIAIDLSAQQEARYAQSGIPTGMEYLLSRLLPWRKPIEVPTLARVIMKTTTLASRREVEFARRTADLYLNVPIARFDLLDWHQFHPIVEAGYRYASSAIRDYLTRHPGLVRRPAMGDLITGRGA